MVFVPFTNPIIAGLTLIRTAIRSPNYVANVSGWSINKDGSAEFNDVVIRGTVVAGGGAVTLNSTGVHVVGSGNQYDISTTGGFAARNDPDNGALFQITAETLYFRPETPSPLGNTVEEGYLHTGYTTFSGGTVEAPTLALASPNIAGQADARLYIRGQKSGSAFDDSSINAQCGAFVVDATQVVAISSTVDTFITSGDDLVIDSAGQNLIESVSGAFITDPVGVVISNRLISDDVGMDFPASQLFQTSIAVVIGNTAVALGNTNYPVAFPAGYTLYGFANITNSAGAASLWYPRFIPVSNTQYNVIVYRPAAAVANATLNIDIAVFIVPA